MRFMEIDWLIRVLISSMVNSLTDNLMALLGSGGNFQRWETRWRTYITKGLPLSSLLPG
jgi:hypothetical protein